VQVDRVTGIEDAREVDVAVGRDSEGRRRVVGAGAAEDEIGIACGNRAVLVIYGEDSGQGRDRAIVDEACGFEDYVARRDSDTVVDGDRRGRAVFLLSDQVDLVGSGGAAGDITEDVDAGWSTVDAGGKQVEVLSCGRSLEVYVACVGDVDAAAGRIGSDWSCWCRCCRQR
jgi:hypothetical protein